jgi:transcription elongation factor Elf1
VQPIGLGSDPCPHCGGELEWKASVGSLEKKELEIHFFQCEQCDRIHTLERKVR